MGNCCNNKAIVKNGRLYDEVKNQIKPLDLLVFKGDDFVSDVISILEKRGHHYAKGGDFTHAGMVVSSEVLNEPLLQEGKLYILESTVSGRLGSGVNNIYGKSFLGVQIRDLEEVVNAYDKPNDTAIAWCPLISDLNYVEVKPLMTEVYHTINGLMWDANCYSLCSALYPCLRPCRSCVEKSLHTEKWLFCSEMVATVYQRLGVLPPNVCPKDVLPADLAYPNEDTDKMPKIIREVVNIISPLHSRVTVSPPNPPPVV